MGLCVQNCVYRDSIPCFHTDWYCLQDLAGWEWLFFLKKKHHNSSPWGFKVILESVWAMPGEMSNVRCRGRASFSLDKKWAFHMLLIPHFPFWTEQLYRHLFSWSFFLWVYIAGGESTKPPNNLFACARLLPHEEAFDLDWLLLLSIFNCKQKLRTEVTPGTILCSIKSWQCSSPWLRAYILFRYVFRDLFPVYL